MDWKKVQELFASSFFTCLSNTAGRRKTAGAKAKKRHSADKGSCVKRHKLLKEIVKMNLSQKQL